MYNVRFFYIAIFYNTNAIQCSECTSLTIIFAAKSVLNYQNGLSELTTLKKQTSNSLVIGLLTL
jgi:hypothetical protein